MKFKVGDIITGVGRRYSITTKDAIMEVIGTTKPPEIRVKIIKHKTDKNRIGSTFIVETKHFKKVNEPLTESTMDNKHVYWENTEDGHSKFWAAHIIEKNMGVSTGSRPLPKKYILIRKWGRIGNNPQTMEQAYDSRDEAEDVLKRSIWGKEKKGYKPIF